MWRELAVLHKNLILSLILSLLLPSFSVFGEDVVPESENFALGADLISFDPECKDGECVDQLVEQYEAVATYAKEQGCLPPDEATDEEVSSFFEDALLNENCLMAIRALKKLEDHMLLIESEMVNQAEGQDVRCEPEEVDGNDILSADLVAAVENETEGPQCTEEKREQIKSDCLGDAGCAIAANLAGLAGGFVVEMIGGKEALNGILGENCSAFDDNCMVQLASGFINAALAFFEGTWSLLKMAGSGIKNGVVSAWNSFWEVEDESSTDALAMAEASEDESAFQLFLNSPGKALSNMWEGLVGMIKNWMANDVFCQKWEGLAHQSECLEPAAGWDCISCKSMFNGGCHLVGAVLAEVVPAFLTGGAITAIKHGGKAAASLAKGIKFSEKNREAIKASRIGNLTSKASRETSSLLNQSKFLGSSKALMSKTLQTVKRFMVSPLRAGVSRSLDAMANLGNKLGTYKIVQNGKTLIGFGWKGFKKFGKVIIYPIENPLTRKAFDLGLNVGKPKVIGAARASGIAADTARALEEVDEPFVQMTKAGDELSGYLKGNRDGVPIDRAKFDASLEIFVKSRDEYLKLTREKRLDTVPDLLAQKEVKVANVIEELFPELKYADNLSRTVSKSDVVAAERELGRLISQVNDPIRKQQLTMEFQHWRSQPSRRVRNLDRKKFFHPQEVMLNARLGPKARAKKGLEISGLKVDNLPREEVLSFERAIENAHLIGVKRGAGVYEYTPLEISQKFRVLRDSGFSSDQAGYIIRSGIAGGIPDLAKVEKINPKDIPELIKSFSDLPLKQRQVFEDFLTKNRIGVNELLERGNIKSLELSPENIHFITSKKTGNEYFLLKSSYSPESYVFRADGKSFGLLKKKSHLKWSELKTREGNIFENSLGDTVFREAGPSGNLTEVKIVSGKIPTTKNEFKYWKEFVLERTPYVDPADKARFSEFLKKNSDEIFAQFQAGKISPDQINPALFKEVYEPFSDQRVYLFGDIAKEDEIRNMVFFTKEKGKRLNGTRSGSVQEFNGDTPTRFILDDGRYLDITKGEFGIFNNYRIGEGAVTEKFFDGNKYFDDLFEKSKSIPNFKGADYQKFLQTHADTLKNSLIRQRLIPQQLEPENFFRFKGNDGVEYALLRSEPYHGSQVLRMDGGLIDGKPYQKVGQILAKVGRDIDFNNGFMVRSWEENGFYKFKVTSRIENELRYLADDITRRFDFKTNKGRSNGDFVDFVRQSESSLQELVRNGKISLNSLEPSNFRTISTVDESMGFNFIKNGSNVEDWLFFPKNSQALPSPYFNKPYLTASELRNLSDNFDGNLLSQLRFHSEGVSFSDAVKLKGVVTHSYSEIVAVANSNLTVRLAKAEIRFGRTLSDSHKLAIEQALQVGKSRGAGAFSYTQQEIKEIKRILLNGGFTDSEASYLVRSGAAARPPNRFSGQGDGFFSSSNQNLGRVPFNDSLQNLENALATAGRSKEDVQRISENIKGLYFVDYSHISDELIEVSLGNKKLQDAGLSIRYNNNDNAFGNFDKTNKWLMDEKPEISLETFKRIQARFMEGGVENIRVNHMGDVRDAGVIGNVPSNKPIDSKTLSVIEENDYTSFKIFGNNDGQKFYGEIQYPNIPNVKDTALSKIEGTYPELVADIRTFRDINGEIGKVEKRIIEIKDGKARFKSQLEQAQIKKAELDGLFVKTTHQNEEYLAIVDSIADLERKIKNFETDLPQFLKNHQDQLDILKTRKAEFQGRSGELQKSLVEALTRERIDWYNRSRKRLGVLDSPDQLEAFSNIVAKFQRDLVSIHPFGNGNGRSTRQFALYYPLMKEGFPPPRLLDPNLDLYRPLSEWQEQVKQGILSSQNLIDDLEMRARFGLALEDSPELIAPLGKQEVRPQMLRDKKKDPWVEGPTVEAIDKRQYREYIEIVLENKPELRAQLKTSPKDTWDKIHEEAQALYKENNIYYDYKNRRNGKERVERLRLGLVDDDYKAMFGVSSFDDPVKYQHKMDSWYDEEINWRGLATRNPAGVRGDEGILDLFRELDMHMTSNNILRTVKSGKPKDIKAAALENMNSYEKSLFNHGDGDLADISKWHSEAINPHYGDSIGYSTSKTEKVGQDFAMGAMVVGEYRTLPGDKIPDYLKPQNQAKVHQRIVVGARRSVKDVDFMRLKKLRDKFSYKYFRQQEVMGVGAADPDSIMILKVMNSDRSIEKSFVRNPDKPWEIWVVKGNAEPGKKPGAANLLETLDLRSATGRLPASP